MRLFAQGNDEHTLLAFGIDDGHFGTGVFFPGRAGALDCQLLVTGSAVNGPAIVAKLFGFLIIRGFLDSHGFAFLADEGVTAPLLDFLDFLLC